MQSADKHHAITDVCHTLWKRADFTDQVMNPDTPVNIPATAITTLYLAFDKQVSWPEATFRDRFSTILLKSLHESDSKERENAKEEAKYGFEHLRATLAHCTHEGMKSIADDLGTIILEAEKGAQIEIDHECARRQYDMATAIYSRDPVTITVNNDEYHINIKAVTLYDVGEGYQLIDLANGIEFNDLKKLPGQEALCQAVARAVYTTELENMLAGRPCDFDRHGAQARIVCKELAPGLFEVTVVNYDFGEIPPELPTQAQLRHCQNFINELSATLFSSSNLFYYMIGSLDNATLTEQLTQQMLAYIRRYDNASQDNNDLSRLRGMFKGMLALNDYFVAIPKTKSFMLELNALFSQYAESPSYVSSALGLFTGASRKLSESTKSLFNICASMQ